MGVVFGSLKKRARARLAQLGMSPQSDPEVWLQPCSHVQRMYSVSCVAFTADSRRLECSGAVSCIGAEHVGHERATLVQADSAHFSSCDGTRNKTCGADITRRM